MFSWKGIVLAGRIIAAILLFLALAPRPESYHVFLRWTVAAVSGASFIRAQMYSRVGWAWLFLALMVLFNPFWLVPLTRSVWPIVDVIAGLLLLASIADFR